MYDSQKFGTRATLCIVNNTVKEDHERLYADKEYDVGYAQFKICISIC